MKAMKVLTLLAAVTVVAAPGVAAADKVHKVAFLSASASPAFLDALKEGLRELGYVDGKNISLDIHSVGDDADVNAIAAQLVAAKADVIVAGGTKSVVAVKKATTTIPIVMTNCGHPVDTGIVQSLTRPGGNITGLSQNSPQLAPKRLELLKSAFPAASRIGVVYNPEHSTAKLSLEEVQAATSELGLTLVPLPVSKADAVAGLKQAAAKEKADALLVLRDPFTVKHAQHIVDQLTAAKLPAMYESRNYLDAGGLMLYGPSFADLYKRSAVFIDKILKGQSPAEIPIEVPATFELVVNRKAAAAIGVAIPQSVLMRADEILE